MNGFLNLYKPSGMSSAYVLNAVKRSIRGETVGHMGTLDPLASGVLPVAIGKSTRLFDYLLDKKKEYVATVAFGYMTDTLDLEGKTVLTSEVIPTEEQVKSACKTLVGEVMQVPPVFSAKCVNGKRSYELARKGVAVELPPKKVLITAVEVIEKTAENEYKIKIVCGGGTYIRSIARDLGYACNSCATMTSLVRTASGIFDISSAITVDEFVRAEDKQSLLVSADKAVDYPKISLNYEQSRRLFNGLYDEYDYSDGTYRVYSPSGFYGVGEVKNGKIKVKAYVGDYENL